MKNFIFSDFVKPNIRTLIPYSAKDVPHPVKLDANESPYDIFSAEPSGTEGITDLLNRYPDPEARALRKEAGGTFGVTPDRILVGNGSDEIISLLITTFGGPVLFPVPTFSMYGIIAVTHGETAAGISLDHAFDLDVESILSEAGKIRPKLIFISSPNNPTGNCFTREKIIRIIRESDCIVIVDEAYQPFAPEPSFIGLLPEYRNLGVLRTLSKIGFAALRVGFLVADPGMINETNKVRLPYNINAISQKLSVLALRKKRAVKNVIRTITCERDTMLRELAGLESVSVFPSDANFILFRVPDSTAVCYGLAKNGILVKNLDGLIGNAIRVTIGTPDENALFIKTLKKTLKR